MDQMECENKVHSKNHSKRARHQMLCGFESRIEQVYGEYFISSQTSTLYLQYA